MDEIISKVIMPVVNFLGHHMPFIIGVIVNLLLISFACKLIDIFLGKLERGLIAKNSDTPLINLMPIFNKLLKAIVVFVLLAGFLQSFGYNVSSLIAGFGITGLAVGFAAKEAIGNVFGSIALLADRVYKIGEYISFNGYEGTVEAINLRSTTIRTLDGYIVNVPNNVIANEEISNVSQASRRKIDLTVDIEYGTSNEKIDRAVAILNEVVMEHSLMEKTPFAFIENMAPSSIQVRVVAYATTSVWAELTKAKSEIIREIIHRYRAEGIEFAFPSTSVYMAK